MRFQTWLTKCVNTVVLVAIAGQPSEDTLCHMGLLHIQHTRWRSVC